MSVDITGYVILGVDVQNYLDDLESDDRDDFIDKLETYTENNALEFIYDGMDGEYCYIGEVLNISSTDLDKTNYWGLYRALIQNMVT